jgi:hypothetical protein
MITVKIDNLRLKRKFRKRENKKSEKEKFYLLQINKEKKNSKIASP